MPKRGYDLGVDLYELWCVGRYDLPTVAQVYAEACNAVADTDIGLDDAFRRDYYFGPDRVLDAWRTLRDLCHSFLRDTATNVELTADALCLAVSEYKDADTEARLTLEDLVRTHGDPGRVDVVGLR